MQNSLELSVVIPVYGNPNLLPKLCQRLRDALNGVTAAYEIILVFDCSADDGWEKIGVECEKDVRIKGIKLSRNFGQHYAIMAGLEYAAGEWVVVMDCDLQDRPEEIPRLYARALEGYDIVFAQRVNRKDSFLKRLSSKTFYLFFSYITESKQDASVANFGVYNRKVIAAILSMEDKVKYFPTMAQWVGFEKELLPVEQDEGGGGTSSYSWKKLFELAMDNSIAFSDKPLRLTIQLGMWICSATLVVGSYFFLRYVLEGSTVSGYTSLILSIWFLSGITIFILGIVGVYLGRVFTQTKNRPVFIVDKTENVDDD